MSKNSQTKLNYIEPLSSYTFVSASLQISKRFKETNLCVRFQVLRTCSLNSQNIVKEMDFRRLLEF